MEEAWKAELAAVLAMLILPGARTEFEPYLPNSCQFVLNLASMLKNIEKKCGGRIGGSDGSGYRGRSADAE